MPSTPIQDPPFKEVTGASGLKVGQPVTSPLGIKVQPVLVGDALVIDSPVVGNVVATGPGVIDLSVGGVLGALLDGLGDALAQLKKLVPCTPVAQTTVTVGPNNQIQSITTTTSCVPS